MPEYMPYPGESKARFLARMKRNKLKDTNKDSAELKRLTKGFNKVWKEWKEEKKNAPRTWDETKIKRNKQGGRKTPTKYG
jgi:hypothetical protein